MKIKKVLSIAVVFTVTATYAGTSKPGFAAPSEQSLTGVTQTLIGLLEQQDRTRIDPDDYESTSLHELIRLGTPAGYRLKLRYLEFGMSLVEALKVARDEELKRRLIEMVQWSRNPKVRAEAIITLSTLFDPSHKKYFKSAILDSKVGIRYAGVEALQNWNQEEALSLLNLAMKRDWSPLMQIHAAQALLSLGQQSAIDILWKYLDHESWVVRAMAARYLGDYGQPEDYEKIYRKFIRENKNDYVVAELAIAALKLISQKGDKVSYSPASAQWKKNEEVVYTVGESGVVELEPLIIVPPRLRIPASLRVASQINSRLLDIIKERLDTQLDPVQQNDPTLLEMNELVTPAGFALKTRYSQLSYLVIEGLAGTQDMLLRSELKKLATEDRNPLVRATAIIALAYNRDPLDLNIIQEAVRHPSSIVRFGAMEAIEVGRFSQAMPSLNEIANGDESPALRVYAMQVMAKFGQSSARNLMLTYLDNPDWPARAMAFWYLGRYGDPADYTLILSRIPTERNPFVQSEISLSALRLSPL